jgi:tetratricopeptide (TPR) repeat protein
MKKNSVILVLFIVVLSIFSCITTPRARLDGWDRERYIEEIDVLIVEERYEKAEKLVEEALGKFTDPVDLFYLQVKKSSVLVILKRYAEALDYISTGKGVLDSGLPISQEEKDRLEVELITYVGQIFEKYLIDAQYETNNDRYKKAIALLNEAVREFPDADNMIAINYNIGFNYYKLNSYDDANKYFELVISNFENGEYTVAQKKELRKFVLLSTTLINKIQEDIEAKKDPYRIQDDLKRNKSVRPNNS